jgi:Rad3-related DNA helicase
MNPDAAKTHFAKFASLPFRPYQAEAADFAVNRSVAPVVAQDGPTGCGKSLELMVALRMAGGGIYLCHSLNLQRQLHADFPEAAVLFGRSNYSCPECLGDDCSQGRVLGCQYALCPYKIARQEAEVANIAILNYQYFFLAANFANTFSGAGLIACDEADVLKNMLIEFCSPGISGPIIKDLSLPRPEFASASNEKGVARWKFWGRAVKGTVVRAKNKLALELRLGKYGGRDLLNKSRRVDAYKSLLARLDSFILNVDSTWLFTEEKSYSGFGNSWLFKPIWITEQLAHSVFWRHAHRFILASATLPPQAILPTLFGLPAKNIERWDIPSSFDPARRKVFRTPVANMTFKTFNTEAPKLCREIAAILKHHQNDKGVIHGVSYKLCKFIREHLKSPRLVYHESRRGKESAIAGFMESDKPLVLLSPSCERGIDLRDDLGRFVIWAKAPWLNLGDKVVKARAYSGVIGNFWYQSSMLQTVVQGCGRTMRSVDDWCVCYLLDKQITDLLNPAKSPQTWHMVPSWFQDAIQHGDWHTNSNLEELRHNVLDTRRARVL